MYLGREAGSSLYKPARINAENFSSLRTLIIADEGSRVPTWKAASPKFETATLHSAVVELVYLKMPIQYVTVQN